MIRFSELNPRNLPLTPEIKENLDILLERLNAVRKAYGKPMIVTSGLRSAAKQQQLIDEGKSTAKKSKHLLGQAADIQCKNGDLKQWVLDHVKFISEVQLWMEDFSATPTWVHFQIVPPKSNKRFFLP